MTTFQNIVLGLVGIIGLILILFGIPNTPKIKPFNCENIGAIYLHHGLCVKPDGSVWTMPQ